MSFLELKLKFINFINNLSIFFLEMEEMKIYFIFVVLMVFLCVYLFSFYYLNKNNSFIFFFFVLFLFASSMIILLFSKSMILLFLGWDGLGITSYILVNFFKNWNTLNNSILTFLSNRVGDIFFLILFSFMIYNFSLNKMFFLSFMLFFLSITKSAQFPFMSWLPAAMAAPTPVSALVHSSTLVTAGVFILFFFKNNLFLLNLKFLFILSLLTLISSGISAILESDFKKMVAFSTLSQVGFLFLMISNFKFILCFFHLFSHAFFKSMLFISVGSILHSSFSSQEARSFLKNSNTNLISKMILILSIFNLMGLFFLSGFWSKDLFLMFFSVNNILFTKMFMYFIISLTLFYSSKMVYFLLNFNLLKSKENSLNFNLSLFLLLNLSMFFSLMFFENYLFFFENYLFFFENWLYFLFLLSMILFWMMFYKMFFKKMFYKIIGLMNLNFFLTLIYNNFFNFLEKKLLDNNFFKMINMNYFKKNNYFIFFMLMFLLLF